jgi:hypothetical protein
MNEVTTSKSFEERMFEQIKSQMGDLLTANELKDILEKSIQKAFFEPRKTKTNYNTTEIEPLFVELIREELKPLIQAGANQWLKDNQDKVDEILKTQIGENAAQFMANAFSAMMYQPMQNMVWELQSKLSNQGIHI